MSPDACFPLTAHALVVTAHAVAATAHAFPERTSSPSAAPVDWTTPAAGGGPARVAESPAHRPRRTPPSRLPTAADRELRAPAARRHCRHSRRDRPAFDRARSERTPVFPAGPRGSTLRWCAHVTAPPRGDRRRRWVHHVRPRSAATITEAPPGPQPTRCGRPAPLGSGSSRSEPLSRFMTHTVAGVESLSEVPRRNTSAPPSGERAGLSSATLVKVIATGWPPSGRTAYRSLLGPLPPTNTAYGSLATSIWPRSGGSVGSQRRENVKK